MKSNISFDFLSKIEEGPIDWGKIIKPSQNPFQSPQDVHHSSTNPFLVENDSKILLGDAPIKSNSDSKLKEHTVERDLHWHDERKVLPGMFSLNELGSERIQHRLEQLQLVNKREQTQGTEKSDEEE